MKKAFKLDNNAQDKLKVQPQILIQIFIMQNQI